MAKNDKSIYQDTRDFIVNNAKNVLKRGGEYAASQPAKIYGTLTGPKNQQVGMVTLNKNKARRESYKDSNAIYGRLEHSQVQNYLGKGSKAEKQFKAKLSEQKPEYTTGMSYADDIAEMKAGKSNIEFSVRKTNPAKK